MQLKEIQAMHARFARETITIHLPGQRVAPAALAAPERRQGAGASDGAWGYRARIIKYAGWTLCACLIGGAVGVSSADLFRAIVHRTSAPGSMASQPVAHVPTPPANTIPPTGQTGSASTVAPLTTQRLNTGGSLQEVNPSDFSQSVNSPDAPSQRSGAGQAGSDTASAMASPIRSTRLRGPASSVVSAAQGMRAGVEAQDDPSHASQERTARQETPARTVVAASNSTARPLIHRRAKAVPEAPATDAPVSAPAQAPTSQHPPRASDVQLF